MVCKIIKKQAELAFSVKMQPFTILQAAQLADIFVEKFEQKYKETIKSSQ